MDIPDEPEGESVYGCCVPKCEKCAKWIYGTIPLCHEHAVKNNIFKSPFDYLPKVPWPKRD